MTLGCQSELDRDAFVTFPSARGSNSSAGDMVEVCRTEPAKSMQTISTTSRSSGGSTSGDSSHAYRYARLLTLFTPLHSDVDSDLAELRFALYALRDERDLALRQCDLLGSSLWPAFQIAALAVGADSSSSNCTSSGGSSDISHCSGESGAHRSLTVAFTMHTSASHLPHLRAMTGTLTVRLVQRRREFVTFDRRCEIAAYCFPLNTKPASSGPSIATAATDRDIVCRERLLESPFAFAVSYAAVHAAFRQRVLLRDALIARCDALKSKPLSFVAGDPKRGSNSSVGGGNERQAAAALDVALAARSREVESLEAQIALCTRLAESCFDVLNEYSDHADVRRFKASTERSQVRVVVSLVPSLVFCGFLRVQLYFPLTKLPVICPLIQAVLRYVPINCHVHAFEISILDRETGEVVEAFIDGYPDHRQLRALPNSSVLSDRSIADVGDNADGAIDDDIATRFTAASIRHLDRFAARYIVAPDALNKSTRRLIGLPAHSFRTVTCGAFAAHSAGFDGGGATERRKKYEQSVAQTAVRLEAAADDEAARESQQRRAPSAESSSSAVDIAAEISAELRDAAADAAALFAKNRATHFFNLTSPELRAAKEAQAAVTAMSLDCMLGGGSVPPAPPAALSRTLTRGGPMLGGAPQSAAAMQHHAMAGNHSQATMSDQIATLASGSVLSALTSSSSLSSSSYSSSTAMSPADMARSVVAAAAEATRARSVQCHAAATRELELERLLIEERTETVFTQALAAACTAFCARVVELGRCSIGSGGSSQNVVGVAGSKRDHRPSTSAADGSALVLERFAHIGMLLHVESLLSTMNDEIGMIGDMRAAVQQLRRVRFRVQCGAPTPKSMSAAAPSQSSSQFGDAAVSAASGPAAAAFAAAAGAGGSGITPTFDTDEALLSGMRIFIEDESAWPFFRAHPTIAPPMPPPTQPPPPPKHDLLSLNPLARNAATDEGAASVVATQLRVVANAAVAAEAAVAPVKPSRHRRTMSAQDTAAAFAEHFGAPVERAVTNSKSVPVQCAVDVAAISEVADTVPVVAVPVKSTRLRRAMTAQDAEAAFAEHFGAPVMRAASNSISAAEAAVDASAAPVVIASPVRGAVRRLRSGMGSTDLDAVFEEHFGAPVESSASSTGRDDSTLSALPDSPSTLADCSAAQPPPVMLTTSSGSVSSPKMTPLRQLLSRQEADGRDSAARKDSHVASDTDAGGAKFAAVPEEAAVEEIVVAPKLLASPNLVRKVSVRSYVPRQLSLPTQAPSANASLPAGSVLLPATASKPEQPQSDRPPPRQSKPRPQTQRHRLCGSAVATALPMHHLPLLSHHQVESPAQPRQPSNPSSLSAPDASAESVDYARPLILNVLVPPELFACLPPGFTFADDGDAGADQAGSAVEAAQNGFNSGAASAKSDTSCRRNEVALVPVLFTQGVNEMQSGMFLHAMCA
jgi:hypothetical protein